MIAVAPATTPAPPTIVAPARDLADAALYGVQEAQVRIERTITGIYEPNPGLAPAEGIALQSAVEAVGLLGESLGAAKAIEDNTRDDALAGAVYAARTSLMFAQTSLTHGLHVMAKDGFAAAREPFTDARTTASDAVTQLKAIRASI